MNDTITVKPITATSINAANLGTARDFARVASADKNAHTRRNDILGSLNPAYLRIRHGQTKTVRTVSALVEQHLTRVDAQSNPLSEIYGQVSFTANVPPTQSEEEFVASCLILFGALIGTGDCAMLRSLYRGEY